MKDDNNNLSYADEQYLLGQITEKYDYYDLKLFRKNDKDGKSQ